MSASLEIFCEIYIQYPALLFLSVPLFHLPKTEKGYWKKKGTIQRLPKLKYFSLLR